MPAFSARNSTEPPLAPLTAVVTSMVTVPTFGLGISPRGPKTLPSLPTKGIKSGVATTRRKVEAPPCPLPPQSPGPAAAAAGGLGFICLDAAGEHGNAHVS